MSTENIREHMDVIGSCGTKVGRIDKVDGRSIKLTKDAEGARGEHRFIPLDWVARVDQHVHLSKMAGDVREQWQAHPVEKGEYMPEG